ncbi:MAG: DUF503 domain-containing protein [Planctomycetes bacterium]|nr:DUF503 domain-containing protein [Planctomycetota bacterium]MCD7895501.1 DUF503 domain-containing protein [Planctomycetaceae bacterium]
MRMGFLKIVLLIHGSRSLKEKRRPLKSFIEKLRNRFNASVAEVGSQDMHQRAEVGVAVVASDGGILARELQAIREYAYGNPDCEVLDIQEESVGWRDA